MINEYTKISDLTVGEFLSLVRTAGIKADIPRVVTGISGLADLFNTSASTAKRIKASGIINAAISQSGRTIIVDADKALELYRKATKSKHFNL